MTDEQLESGSATSIPMRLCALVAGHRDLGGHDEAVRASLTSVLTAIKASAEQVSRDCGLSLLSGSADGTDALAQSIGEECGFALSIIAYGPVSDMAASAVRVVTFGFDSAEPPASPFLHRAVAMRDSAALQFSDLVVVVWDGGQPRDGLEGTVRILREALLCRKCVIWIKLSATPEIRITGLDKLATVDPLSLPEDAPPHMLAAPFVPFAGSSDRNLERILGAHLSGAAAEKIGELLAHQPRRRRPGLFDRVARALILASKDPLDYYPRKTVPLPPATSWGAVPAFDDLFAQADVAANLAAGDYRTRTWLLYLFGTLAVALGALGILTGARSFQLGWHVAELVSIVVILVVLLVGHGRRLHRRWTTLRSLAEHLRYQRFVYPLAGVIAPLRQPLWHLVNGEPEPRDPIAWLLHRLNIAAGLPTLRGATLDIAHALQGDDLAGSLIALVEHQCSYHKAKAASEERLRHRLEVGSTLLFFATLAAVAVGLCVHSRVLWFMAVSGPALAAGLYGVATQLELARIAQQSREQAKALDRHLGVIDKVRQGSTYDPWLATAELRRVLIQAGDLMVAEFAAWESLVLGHQLGLPA